jgi:hypothetical protein
MWSCKFSTCEGVSGVSSKKVRTRSIIIKYIKKGVDLKGFQKVDKLLKNFSMKEFNKMFPYIARKNANLLGAPRAGLESAFGRDLLFTAGGVDKAFSMGAKVIPTGRVTFLGTLSKAFFTANPPSSIVKVEPSVILKEYGDVYYGKK